MSEVQEKIKNRRGLLSQVSHPHKQLKYALLMGLVTGVSLLLANGLILARLSNMSAVAENPLDQEILGNLLEFLLLTTAFTSLIAFAISFYGTIFITHRFIGPLNSLLKFVSGLPDQKSDLPDIVLRQRDELHELANELNALKARLNGKPS